jgi:hypothetical protein
MARKRHTLRLSIDSGAISQAWSARQQRSANGVPPWHNLTFNPSKAPIHHILKDQVYAGSSGHWFGIFSKFRADGLASGGAGSAQVMPHFLTGGRASDEHKITL